jgi:hypothetical protein
MHNFRRRTQSFSARAHSFPPPRSIDARVPPEAVPSMRDHHGEPSPYRLITTDDPTRTLGQGEVRHFRTLVQAANAL